MPSRKLTICNDLGMHARAATRLVECANRYGSEVVVSYQGKTVNGKSIMGVLMLAAAKGAEIEVNTSGADEDAALAGLVALVNDGFGELTP